MDRNYILLAPSMVPTSSFVELLRYWGFFSVEVSNVFLSDDKAPTQEENFLISLKRREVNYQQAQEIYSALYLFEKNLWNDIEKQAPLSLDTITLVIRKAIENFRTYKNHLLDFDIVSSANEDYDISHALKTFFLALVMGIGIKLPPFKLIDLGIAAFLHEIGVQQIPNEIYKSNQSLTPAEREKIQLHVILGYRTLTKLRFNPEITRGALEHHERMDGSGYPRHLRGPEISLFGKILAIACSFGAQISYRPFQEAKHPHSGLINLLKQREKYDETLLKVLLTELSLYPIGSYVRLQNGNIGMVVKANPNNIKAPFVKLLIDTNQKIPLTQEIIDTSDDNLQIEEVLPMDKLMQYSYLLEFRGL